MHIENDGARTYARSLHITAGGKPEADLHVIVDDAQRPLGAYRPDRHKVRTSRTPAAYDRRAEVVELAPENTKP